MGTKLDKLKMLGIVQNLAIEAFSDVVQLINKCCSEGYNCQPINFNNDLIDPNICLSPRCENRHSRFKIIVEESLLEVLRGKAKDESKLSGDGALIMSVNPASTKMKHMINRKYVGYLPSRFAAGNDESTEEDEKDDPVMEEVD